MSDVERYMQGVLDGRIDPRIEVDLREVPTPSGGYFGAVAERARQRADEIRQGRGRVAYIYGKTGRRRHLIDEIGAHGEYIAAIGVTVEQCSQLVAAGARWVGAEVDAPASKSQQ